MHVMFTQSKNSQVNLQEVNNKHEDSQVAYKITILSIEIINGHWVLQLKKKNNSSLPPNYILNSPDYKDKDLNFFGMFSKLFFCL